MKQLVKELIFKYRADDGDFPHRFLYVYADGEEVVCAEAWDGGDDILDEFGDMALEVLGGSYEGSVYFDDEDEGYDIGFSKGGKILQIKHSGQRQDALYIEPRQFVDAVLDLLENDTTGHASSDRIISIKKTIAQNGAKYSDDDPELRFDIKEVSGGGQYSAMRERLRIQYGDSYYFVESKYINISKKLLNAAIMLLEGEERVELAIVVDVSDDYVIPKRAREREVGAASSRIFRMDIARIPSGEYLELSLTEEPWGCEYFAIVSKDEFFTAVDDMVARYNRDTYFRFQHLLKAR